MRLFLGGVASKLNVGIASAQKERPSGAELRGIEHAQVTDNGSFAVYEYLDRQGRPRTAILAKEPMFSEEDLRESLD